MRGFKMDNEVKIFEGNQIPSLWDNEKEECKIPCEDDCQYT